MTINPYEAFAKPAEPLPTNDELAKADRPVGIAILAILHLLAGMVLFFSQFALLARLREAASGFAEMGYSVAAVAISMAFLTGLCMASGIGMWRGTRWGWWCGAFYCVYSVFRNGSALLTFVLMADQLQGIAQVPDYYWLKHGSRIAVQSLVYIYFFKSSVLAFFQMQSVRKVRATATLIGICIAISVAATLLNFIAVAAN